MAYEQMKTGERVLAVFMWETTEDRTLMLTCIHCLRDTYRRHDACGAPVCHRCLGTHVRRQTPTDLQAYRVLLEDLRAPRLCWTCNGTGEGAMDGQRCWTCHEKGC